MNRFLGSFGLAAIATLCAGCIAPLEVSGTDIDVTTIVAPADYKIVRFPQDDVAVEPIDSSIASDSPLSPWERARVRAVEPIESPPAAESPPNLSPELQRVARTITATQPPPPLPASTLGTLQQIKPIRAISLDITPPQLADDQQLSIAMPQNFAAEALPILAQQQVFSRSDLAETGFDWHPSVEGLTFCYQPLYFEDVNLERYGRSHGILQPFVSVAKFGSRIPALPYMVFARPARRCTDHPHWTLPGYKIHQREPHEFVPSIPGAAAEVAAVYGLILLIP